MTITVLLVDDQELVRTGFRMILESEPDLRVLDEAASGDQAIALARQLEPDVVLMDVQMPGIDGIGATREITNSPGLTSRVVILTTFERDDYLFGALRAGASGFLLKNAPPEALVRAIRLVASGEALLDPAVTRRVIEQFADRPVVPAAAADLAELTAREHEVLLPLGRGHTNAEIGEQLVVSPGTVKSHVSSVLAKLGLRDRAQAVVFAYENGLLTPRAVVPPPS